MSNPLRKNFPLHLGRIIPAENPACTSPPPENSAAPQVPTTEATDDIAILHETEVTLLRDGERVKSIVIKCSCGQVISLDCEY